MFQNIQEETKAQTKEETRHKKNILANVISKKYILLNGDQRISSPYTIKAIGDKKKLLETLNLKDEGYIDLYKNAGYDIKIEENDNITIYKYNKDIDLKYIDKGEDK